MRIAAIGGGLIVIALVTALTGQASDSSSASESSDSSISANVESGGDAPSIQTINSEIESGQATLLDVRTKAEFDQGHFRGAKLHDSVKLDSGQMPELDKDSKIYLYCRSGNRSSQSIKTLEAAGFTNVVDLGGLPDVQKLGGELVK